VYGRSWDNRIDTAINPAALKDMQATGATQVATRKKAGSNEATTTINAFEAPPCNNTSLRLAARRLGNLYDDALKGAGLKSTQFALMVEIARLGAANAGLAPTLQDLAARLAIQISALTHAVRPLVRDGLVVLQPDPADGRTKRAALSDTGLQRLEAAAAHWADTNARVEAVLGAGAAAALRALADRVSSDEFLVAFNQTAPTK
jgi:DNA-binding MarR family transcriptional regulator